MVTRLWTTGGPSYRLFPVRVVTWVLWAKAVTVAVATVAAARVRIEVA
jgi:hypothetical protein